jgi:hypothetical protein
VAIGLDLWYGMAWHGRGGIHPRIKRPVGRRLAHAAARQLKRQAAEQQAQKAQQRLGGSEQESALSGGGGGGGGSGAITGPTIAGCTATASSLTLKFNSSLLGPAVPS